MSFIEIVLENLQASVEETASLLDAIARSSKGSYLALWRQAYRAAPGVRFNTNWAEAYRERKRFLTMLSRLKKEGLIAPANKQRGIKQRWKITTQGRERLKLSRRKLSDIFSIAHIRSYASPKGHAAVLITFDVPEKEKHKRHWLRGSLVQLGFPCFRRAFGSAAARYPKSFSATSRRSNSKITFTSSPFQNAGLPNQ